MSEPPTESDRCLCYFALKDWDGVHHDRRCWLYVDSAAHPPKLILPSKLRLVEEMREALQKIGDLLEVTDCDAEDKCDESVGYVCTLHTAQRITTNALTASLSDALRRHDAKVRAQALKDVANVGP